MHSALPMPLSGEHQRFTKKEAFIIPPPPRPRERRKLPLPQVSRPMTSPDSRFGSSFEDGFADGAAEFGGDDQADLRYARPLTVRMRRLMLRLFAAVSVYLP